MVKKSHLQFLIAQKKVERVFNLLKTGTFQIMRQDFNLKENLINNHMENSNSINPSQNGLKYKDLDWEDKYYAFMADPEKVFFNRGKLHGYRLKGDDEARAEHIEYLVAEFKSVIQALIWKTKEDILEYEVSAVRSEKMQKRSIPLIENRKERLVHFETQYENSKEKKGIVEHSIQSYISGFQNGTDLAWDDMFRGRYDSAKTFENKAL